MDNKIEQIAIQTYKDHTEKYASLRQRWVELIKRYENELREGSITSDTTSKTRLGQAFALVENFVSRVVAQAPQFNYLARERKDTDFVDQYKEFNEYQNEEANSREHYESIAKWGAICGLSGWSMGWKTEEIIRKKKGKEVMGKTITNPMLVETMDKLSLGRSIKVDDNETISNWTIDAIAPYDLIWSTNAEEVEDCAVLGYRVHNKTLGMLKEEGYDTKNLAQAMRNDEDYWKGQIEQYKGMSTNKIEEQALVELAELNVKILKKGMWEYHVVTLADIADDSFGGQPVAIRNEPNPLDKQFTPMGVFRPIKRPGKFYGFGIIEPVMGVLDSEEDSFNLVLESFLTDVARPMEYVPGNVIDENALEFKPRTLVPVRKLGESVSVLPTPAPNMGSASFMLGYLEKTKQNVTAITDYQTGADQKQSSQTATEVKTKTFLSEQRTNKILQRFESDVLQVAGKYALWFNQQYLSDNKKAIYRVLGQKGELMEKEVKFKDIEAIKDVLIVPGSSAYLDRNEERLKWRQLLLDSVQEAQMGQLGVPMDREYIWKKYLVEGFGIKDPDNLIPSLKEREEESVKKKQADLKQAKEENLDPATARVMPNDDPRVHLPIHQAALRNQGVEGTRYTPEQLQMLTEHINEHTRLAGGAVPTNAQAMEGAVGQRIANNVNPQQNAPDNAVPRGQ